MNSGIAAKEIGGIFRTDCPFRGVDAVEAYAFGVVIVQDFEGVGVEHRYDGAGEVGEAEIRDRKTAKLVRRSRITIWSLGEYSSWSDLLALESMDGNGGADAGNPASPEALNRSPTSMLRTAT